jgi:hypothetical protein
VGKHGERIAETVVALAPDAMKGAMRQKLAGQGILVEGGRRKTTR